MATEDIRENEMPNGAPVSLRGLDVMGNGISILLRDIIKLIMPFTLEYKGALGQNISLDDIENSFGYAYTYNDETGVFGPFISFGIPGYQVQLKGQYEGESIYFRVKFEKTHFSPWKKISFTS